MKRRKFFKYATAAIATPFLFRGQWISAMANQSELDLISTFNPHRKLVLIQLDGGNDGLNMLIPISEYDNLANARGNILVEASKILKLTDETGLHPSMPELTSLYHDGKVQFIQGVGYPTPNLSHFRSKDIITSASDSKTVLNTGWAGEMFNSQYADYPYGYPNEKNPHPIALTIGSTSSPTCQGDLVNFSSVLANLSSAYSSSAENQTFPNTPFGNELKFITNMMEQTESYLSVIKEAAAKAKNLSTQYPVSGQNSLADKLKLVANLIGGGLQTQIYIVSIGGWDLHSSQVTSLTDKLTGKHPTLLGKVSNAIAAFVDDLKLMGKADEVMGFVFTEFGRRIKSNDSLGTDHGTTWPAIVFGSRVEPGITGVNPTIPAVVGKSDNLPLQNDFRSIYAGFYQQWFDLGKEETDQLLSGSFPELQIIAKNATAISSSETSSNEIKLWPNPVENMTNLAFESNGELTEIQIYSITGQLIENKIRQRFPQGQQRIQLNLGHLPTGNYVLTIKQNNSRNSLKLIKVN
jgi:uncharacterized protein (DUF1501 family)